MNCVDLTYRRTSQAGASGMRLLIALFDTLAGDLRRAAQAQRANDFEQCAAELKHALLVVSYLQSRLEMASGELTAKLDAFYKRLRRRMLAAQARQSPEMLEELMADVLDIRQVWQQIETREPESGPEILPPVRNQQYNGVLSAQAERRQLSWSA